MKLRLLAVAGWTAAGIASVVAALLWDSIPTQQDWDRRYLEGVADGEDRQAQTAGA